MKGDGGSSSHVKSTMGRWPNAGLGVGEREKKGVEGWLGKCGFVQFS